MLRKETLNRKNALLNKLLCNFIASKFLRDPRDRDGHIISQNEYAKLCGISSSTISKLKSSDGYDIPASTFYSICRHEGYTLEQLFREFEEECGVDIPDWDYSREKLKFWKLSVFVCSFEYGFVHNLVCFCIVDDLNQEAEQLVKDILFVLYFFNINKFAFREQVETLGKDCGIVNSSKRYKICIGINIIISMP